MTATGMETHARPSVLARVGRTAGAARRHARPLALKLLSVLWPPNALLVARHTAALSRPRARPAGALDLDGSAGAALDWIAGSQDRVGSGGVGCYEFYGWTTGYPEVTGYIIPTLFDWHHSLGRSDLCDRALRAADWELRIQQPDGGFEGGYEGDGNPPVVFNTGQVIRGLLRAYEETGDERYLDSAHRAGSWIRDNQDDDGSWTTANFKGMKRVYDAYVAAPLARLSVVSGDQSFASAATRSCEFVLSRQRANGWFELADNSPTMNDAPLTHTINYTVDGLLETGEVLGEPRFVEAARLAADHQLELVERTPALPARLDERWRPRARYVCVTGVAQLGIVATKLHERTGDAHYRRAATSIAEFLIGLQRMNALGEARRGALPGSYPVWGFYCPFKLPSWGTKYHLDLLHALREH